MRNCDGLVVTDVQGATLLGCGDDAVGEYCSPDDCSDVSTGIGCYCNRDGVAVDPTEESCANSAQIKLLTTSFIQLIDKADRTGSSNVLFANDGEEELRYSLRELENPEGLAWLASPSAGNLSQCEVGNSTLTLSADSLPSRAAPFVTRFEIRSNSFNAESRSLAIDILTYVSATPSADFSSVNITNLDQLTAAGILQFVIMSKDATDMMMLDTSSILYTGSLLPDLANATDVTCTIRHDATADHHVGECAMPGLVAGGFVLEVRYHSELVGGSAYYFHIERCPESFVLANDAAACTCPAGRYELGGTCIPCTDGHVKPTLGTDKADCVACLTVLGETANTARSACDACITGYYRKGDKCAQCPNFPKLCVDLETSALMPGYWRVGSVGDETTEVHECRFGTSSCPGTAGSASGDQTVCLNTAQAYCGCGYVGPLCSECCNSAILNE